MNLCFATNNRHKVEEVLAIAGGSGKFTIKTLRDIGCSEELAETQDTIQGNAEQKARYVWEKYHISCFADDTGLEVDALNGAPGVYSARYAGRSCNANENIQLLLKNLRNAKDRRARFRTVISLFLPEGNWFFEGTINGTILTEGRGLGGFGYDPVFLVNGFSQTLAEMTSDEKNSISHRAIVVGRMMEFLRTR